MILSASSTVRLRCRPVCRTLRVEALKDGNVQIKTGFSGSDDTSATEQLYHIDGSCSALHDDERIL